jgi:hypothetical protein
MEKGWIYSKDKPLYKSLADLLFANRNMLQTKRKLNTKKVGKTNKPEMKDLFTLG